MKRIIEKIEDLVCELEVEEEICKKKIIELEKKLVLLTEDYEFMRKHCEKLQKYIDSLEIEE